MKYQEKPSISEYYNDVSTIDAAPALGAGLATLLATVRDKCIHCPKCTAQCAFLKQNGDPGTIAASYNPFDPDWLTLAFGCHLCGLCTAVCPVKLSPEAMFLEMRREAVNRNAAPLPSHKGILAYEKKGVSGKYSWYSLPDGCDTVFFPGCTFSGTRMDTTIALYEHLERHIPNVGMVLDCCCKPSHDLGRAGYFQEMFSDLRDWLTTHGVKRVIAVCPNCYKVFTAWGETLKVVSAYELLSTLSLPETAGGSTVTLTAATISIHDPCVLRHQAPIQAAVRDLALKKGFAVHEMPHSRAKTVCCGEGGSVGFVAPEFSGAWGDIRQKEAEDRRLLTYCAGCANFLNRRVPTDHILDAVFFPDAVGAGTRKAAKAPFTYWNRLKLKRYLKDRHPGAATRERAFLSTRNPLPPAPEKIIKFLVLALIVAAILGIHFSGVMEHFDADTLRTTVAAWGWFAPVAFMLIYAIAPSLFLPGLPLTIAGGVLFGPFWGVVYSITGATAGACIAFLISRYAARDWVKAKLTGPRWQSLDRNVEKNGWKIVAFTRLIPLFPFNLLNYAFGLTPIGFLSYGITTFVCMLPACIAFIVFSSSLPGLLKGKISPELIIGIVLILLVSMLPVLVRKIKSKKENL
jgi:uncharacterized membrane protein YdjX (TVP38/TMEM64 family)/Fe-S oxidoreductase